MSAGVFSNAKYSSDAGYVYPAKVQTETLDAVIGTGANASATGTVVAGTPSARMNGSKRTIGVNARTVTLRFTASAPTGYKDGGIVKIPIMTKTKWDAIAKTNTGTYLSTAVIVVGKTPEYIV